MSQTGTPTEFLQLGITEPDDTLNVLVDLNGQWRKIDTGVKNVDTKANTNASGISALNTAVQDNTENITNILETNVNQQTSIDTLQSKVATLEEDDTSYGSRITAVEAGVQENSELINDLEVDLSGVKTSVGTVPSGSNLQGEVDGLDTRVTALENSGSVAAVEARVTTLETEVGTVPAGETVQGQITTLNGQVNSGNIPFRFSVDGGGNYGYLKADDSFVPFSSGSPTEIGQYNIITTDITDFRYDTHPSCFYIYTTSDTTSPYYRKLLYIPTLELIDISSYNPSYYVGGMKGYGETFRIGNNKYYYDRLTKNLVLIENSVACCSGKNSITYYTKETNQYTAHYVDLLDNNNNYTIVFTLDSDKLQSNTAGKKGMIFFPINKNQSSSSTCFYYISNSGIIDAMGNSTQVHYNTLSNSTSLHFFNHDSYSDYVIYPNEIEITPNGITTHADTIYYSIREKYLRFGNYYRRYSGYPGKGKRLLLLHGRSRPSCRYL